MFSSISKIVPGGFVPLKDELLFIEKYIFLQQTRFKEELFFSIEIEDESALNKHIPYLAFQVLVENAIKHNIASPTRKLRIAIKNTGNDFWNHYRCQW